MSTNSKLYLSIRLDANQGKSERLVQVIKIPWVLLKWMLFYFFVIKFLTHLLSYFWLNLTNCHHLSHMPFLSPYISITYTLQSLLSTQFYTQFPSVRFRNWQFSGANICNRQNIWCFLPFECNHMSFSVFGPRISLLLLRSDIQ